MALETLTGDPILTAAEAQATLDVRDEDELVRVVNHVSAQARAFMGRDQLRDADTDIVENQRPFGVVETLFAHASPLKSGYADAKVELYHQGEVSRTYTAADNEVIITGDDYQLRFDIATGCWPAVTGGSFLRLTYRGGWPVIPADVYAGAIMQAKVNLKRLRGEVGMANHSMSGESVQMDRAGIISEVADLWQPYRILA